jgi:hypothetical protein
VWADAYATACARHADVVAVYESPRGRLALLLRQTPAPLAEELPAWLLHTRRAARRILTALRATGFSAGVLILQWLPFEEAARILADWPCRYVGDAARLAALRRLIDRYLADRRFLASRAPEFHTDEDPMTTLARLGDARLALECWYRAMVPRWLAVEPALRRRLSSKRTAGSSPASWEPARPRRSPRKSSSGTGSWSGSSRGSDPRMRAPGGSRGSVECSATSDGRSAVPARSGRRPGAAGYS